MKNVNEIGLFDVDERLMKLAQANDPLVRLKERTTAVRLRNDVQDIDIAEVL